MESAKLAAPVDVVMLLRPVGEGLINAEKQTGCARLRACC